MNNLKIGSFLQALRKAKGLTQADLAEYFEISAKTVSKWECGDSMPEIPMLKALAEFYDVSVDEILNGEKGESKESIKSKNTNEQYFYQKKLHKLHFVQILSFSILAFGYLMIYLLGYTTIRSDVGGWVSVAITFISLVSFIFGNFIVGSLDESLNPDLIKSFKKRRLWWIYIYSFVFIFVFTCAILFYALPPTPQTIVVISSFLWCNLLVLLVVLAVASIFPVLLLCIRCYEGKKIKSGLAMVYYFISVFVFVFAFFGYFFSKQKLIMGANGEMLTYDLEVSWMYWVGTILLALNIGSFLYMMYKKKPYLYCMLLELIAHIFLRVALNDIFIDLDYHIFVFESIRQFSIWLWYAGIVLIILFIMEVGMLIHQAVQNKKLRAKS